jgi:hypothetical protein
MVHRRKSIDAMTPGLLDNSSGSLFALDVGRWGPLCVLLCNGFALHRLFLPCHGSIVLLPDGTSVTMPPKRFESR